MPQQTQSPPSYLFTVRVWQHEVDEETQEWRGRIHHVESGQTRYFRDWAALIPVLLAMLRQAEIPAVTPAPSLPLPEVDGTP